jgi:hypothetical protein
MCFEIISDLITAWQHQFVPNGAPSEIQRWTVDIKLLYLEYTYSGVQYN